MAIVAILSLGVGCAAVLLLMAGFRGQQIDDHPLCARCGFDLVGKPAQSTRCPECGNDLYDRSATRIGNRVRRPRLLWSGATLLAGSLLLAAISIAAAIGRVDLQHWKPAWLLTEEIHSHDQRTRRAAMAEFLRRVQADQLSKDVIRAKTDEAYRYMLYAEPDGVKFFETAYLKGHITSEEWGQQFRKDFHAEFSVAPVAYFVEQIPMAVYLQHWATFNSLVDCSWNNVIIDGAPAPPLQAGSATFSLTPSVGASGLSGAIHPSDWVSSRPFPGPALLPAIGAGRTAMLPGLHTIVGTLRARVRTPSGVALEWFDIPASADVVVVASTAKLAPFKVDEASRAIVDSWAKISSVTVVETGHIRVDAQTLRSMRSVSGARVRTPDRGEMKLSMAPRFPTAGFGAQSFMWRMPPGQDLKGLATVDLIMSFSRPIAASNIPPPDEVVIRNIPVQSLPKSPASQP